MDEYLSIPRYRYLESGLCVDRYQNLWQCTNVDGEDVWEKIPSPDAALSDHDYHMAHGPAERR